MTDAEFQATGVPPSYQSTFVLTFEPRMAITDIEFVERAAEVEHCPVSLANGNMRPAPQTAKLCWANQYSRRGDGKPRLHLWLMLSSNQYSRRGHGKSRLHL